MGEPEQKVENGRNLSNGRFTAGWKGGGRKRGSFDLRRIVSEQSEIAGYDIEGRIFAGVKRVVEIAADPDSKPADAIAAVRAVAAALGESLTIEAGDTLADAIASKSDAIRELASILATAAARHTN